MDLQQVIFDLCTAQGVSGSEEPALALASRLFEPYGSVTTDSNGNLYVVSGNENAAKTILVDAHIDRIGLIVTDIDENGFVKADRCGGADPRTLTNALLTTADGLVGTVCCLPPHLSDGKEDKAIPFSKLWIDFGMSAEQVRQHIAPGDVLTFATQPAALLGGKITSAALDDRCGVAALLRTAERIHGKALDCKVIFLLSAQEETFGSGAVTGAFRCDADEAIAVDVSFASQPDISGQYAKIELGKGPMIGISPILNRPMTDRLIALAKEQDIPFQYEPLSGRTGTNADKISVTKSGVKTALVSVPQRYMHTMSEVIALADVENTAALLAAYLLSGGVD